MAHAPTTDTAGRQTENNVVQFTVPIGRRCCAACVDLVEKRLRENLQVKRVRVNGVEGIAYVDVQPGTVSIEELREGLESRNSRQVVASAARSFQPGGRVENTHNVKRAR